MKQRFKNTAPTYKDGGKSGWISNKISTLMKEGKYPQEQAVAIAYSMYDELPKYQNGTLTPQGLTPMPSAMPTASGLLTQIPQGYGAYNVPAPTPYQMYGESDPYLFQQTANKPQAIAPPVNPQAPLSNNQNSFLQPERKGAYSDANTGNVIDENKTYTNETAKQYNQYQMYAPGFYNPENLAVYAGMNVKKNPVMAGVAGLGVVSGIGRAFLSGMAGENRNMQIAQDYASRQRDKMTGVNNPEYMATNSGANYTTQSYMQEGGEQMPPQEQQQGSQEEQIIMFVQEALQQQTDPAEIVQQLIISGLPQEQAEQMVMAILEQMQGGQQMPQEQQMQQEEQMQFRDGGAYLEKLRGKRILDYTYNSSTGNYDVRYE